MKQKCRTSLGLVAMMLVATAAAFAQVNEPQPNRLTPVPIQQVAVEDSFWSPKLNLWQAVTIRDAFAKFEKDGALNNFDHVRDGLTSQHGGPPWYDGLIYEMIRASADFLIEHPDPALADQVNGYINRITAAAAKDPDGYIETWTESMAPNHRWGLNGGNDVEQHELYNAGALIDAGVHWYQATRQTNLLVVAVRMANDMCRLMGPAPKVNQVPGHELGEEALMNLYLLFREHPELKAQMPVPVNEQDYLKLAEFWIDARGNHDGRSLDWKAYAQDDQPVAQQQEMEGHAVRDALLCSGLAAIGDLGEREDYLASAQRLWNNMVHCKMYLTGGLGSVSSYEGFGPDHDLPNQTAYCETCAAVAGGFFGQNMNLVFADAQYADLLERELFNGALAGVSVKGTEYFYGNPLATDGGHQRWSWHPCPCCPPMFLKLMGALPGYIYAQSADAVYVNQFIGNRASLTVNDTKVGLHLETHYPWNGNVKITLTPDQTNAFDLCVRIPAWCQGIASSNDLYQIAGRPVGGAVTMKINGAIQKNLDLVRGYARLHRQWKAGDVVEANFDMPVREVHANPQVTADGGLVALMRGPVVYCAEMVDNPNGIQQLVIPANASFKAGFKPDLLGGIVVLQGNVKASVMEHGVDHLVSAKLTAIPFYANANRDPSPMRVWLPASLDKATPVTLAMRSHASASHCWHLDSVEAIHDGIVPVTSSDLNAPRLSWWDHKGSGEWAQLDFPKVTKVSQVRIFWFSDRSVNGGCDVPESWTLLYEGPNGWQPVEQASAQGVALDRFNDMTFAPVKTTALRLQVQLKPGWSAGICEWEVE